MIRIRFLHHCVISLDGRKIPPERNAQFGQPRPNRGVATMARQPAVLNAASAAKHRATLLAGTALGLSLVLPAIPGTIGTASAQTVTAPSAPAPCAQNAAQGQLACGA